VRHRSVMQKWERQPCPGEVTPPLAGAIRSSSRTSWNRFGLGAAKRDGGVSFGFS
jgi:hypothetical protein